MIIPDGNARQQVNQGPFKNDSIWNSDFLKKFAVTDANIMDQPGQGKPGQGQPPGKPVDPMLQDALNQSNSSAMSGNMPGANDGRMSGEKEAPLNPVNPQKGSPAAKFLGSDPEKTENAGVSTQLIFQQEQAKIRKFIGNDYGLKMDYNDDGSFVVMITPPKQIPISNPQQFIDELMKYLGGADQQNLQTPPGNEPGPIVVTYTPQALFKVRK